MPRRTKAHLAATLYRIKNPAAKGWKRYHRDSGRVWFNDPTARGKKRVLGRGSNGNNQTITAIATPNPPAGSSATQNQQIVQLLDLHLQSKDRMITGAIELPSQFTGTSLHFINTTTGQDLGTYANILENMAASTPAFKIYNTREDIYSDAELAADHAGSVDPSVTNQKVVFYKDDTDPKLLHFATTFDALGSIQVQLLQNGQQIGYGGLTLHADQVTSDLISEVDARVNNINPPPIVDPTDPTVSGGGGNGDGLGLLIAQEPGSLANPGVIDPNKSNPTQLVLPLHTGTGLPSGTDHDLSLITLRRPSGLTSNVGTVTLTVSSPASVALFSSDASHFLANYSVNLANPSGDLAALATGNAQIWVRGAAANTSVTLTYTYTDTNGIVQDTDAAKISVSTSSAMIWPGGMRDMPLFCGGGIRGPPGVALSLMSLKVWSSVAQVSPTPSGPLTNTGLTTKSLLDYFDAAVQGTWKLPSAYVKGVVDGAWDGFKNDVNGVVALGDLATHPIARGSEIYQGLKALTQLSSAQLVQLGQNMVNSFVTGSEQSLPWSYQGSNPVDQAALQEYIQGYMTGYAGEQIGSCFVVVGTISKVGKVLQTVVEASEAGRLVLSGLNTVMQFRVKALQSIVQFVNDTASVRKAQQMVERIGNFQISGQSAATIIQNYLAGVPGATTNWNSIAKAIAKYASSDMDGVGYGAYKRLAQVINALGAQATEKGILSFAEEYGLLLTGSEDNFNAWLALFDTSSTAGKTEMNTFLENAKTFLDNPNCADPYGGGSALSPGYPVPDYSGFVSLPTTQTLSAGTIIDRYGTTSGRYLAPAGTPAWARSLPPNPGGLSRYRVVSSLSVNSGRAAPWFAQGGAGIQYQLLSGQSVQSLLDAGILEAAP